MQMADIFNIILECYMIISIFAPLVWITLSPLLEKDYDREGC